MKTCPACGTTYGDDSLIYCLADGTSLSSGSGNDVTTVLPAVEEMETVVSPYAPTLARTRRAGRHGNGDPVPAARPGRGIAIKLLAIVAALAVLGLLVVVIAGILLLVFSAQPGPVAENSNKASLSNTRIAVSPTPDETNELRDQIAELERRLNEQGRSGTKNDKPLEMPERRTTDKTARVNSPGDGFLALRSLPNSEIGERILKIPHGARVSIGACGPVVAPVQRRGRWCQASYDEYDGWVFDAYLIYD